jgi:hypothetical protein
MRPALSVFISHVYLFLSGLNAVPLRRVVNRGSAGPLVKSGRPAKAGRPQLPVSVLLSVLVDKVAGIVGNRLGEVVNLVEPGVNHLGGDELVARVPDVGNRDR